MTQLTLWDTDPLLDKHQVAERLNVGIRFVERLIAEKRIAYIKVGRHVRMRASVVDSFVAANTIGLRSKYGSSKCTGRNTSMLSNL